MHNHTNSHTRHTYNHTQTIHKQTNTSYTCKETLAKRAQSHKTHTHKSYNIQTTIHNHTHTYNKLQNKTKVKRAPSHNKAYTEKHTIIQKTKSTKIM